MADLHSVDPKTAAACIRFFGQFGPLWDLSTWHTIDGVKPPPLRIVSSRGSSAILNNQIANEVARSQPKMAQASKEWLRRWQAKIDAVTRDDD